MKKALSAALALSLALTSLSASALERTMWFNINHLHYNGSTNEFFVFAARTLNVAACPDAIAVSFSTVRQSAQRSQMIELVTQAKLHSRQVAFQGTCAPNPQYFLATNVYLR